MSLLFSETPLDSQGVAWEIGDLFSANFLLERHHYLGPIRAADLIVVGISDGVPVAAQVWKWPTARRIPPDGSWLELARWCLTPAAGPNAGSRQHKAALRFIKAHRQRVTTLVSYSDPSVGHTGALYRACNWQWAPPWYRLRPPPTGNGSWDGGITRQEVKDRWVFCIKPDPNRELSLRVKDDAAIRFWQQRSTEKERAWARTSPSVDLRQAVAA